MSPSRSFSFFSSGCLRSAPLWPPRGPLQHQRFSVLVSETGLTVIEVLVAIGVLGILLTMSSVGLGALAPKFNLDNGVRRTAMALNQGRVQAITRGHTVDIAFDSYTFTITDADNGDEVIAGDELPSGITASAGGIITFTALGTAAAPVTVTVSNGERAKDVSVGLTGEVFIE